MTHPRRICVVTGTRAEYGLLSWLIQDLHASPDFELQLVVTGMHLAPEFGMTVSAIEQDGIPIAARVDMLLSSDSNVGTVKSLGLGTIGFADAFDRLQPDLLIVLGDRFEILGAAQAALLMRIPIAHIAGGDTTEGAFDESIRHAITKMAAIHFVTNETARQRVLQLGEAPERVHCVGSPGLDSIRRMPLLDRPELEKELSCRFAQTNLLITYHPETLGVEDVAAPFQELLRALDDLGPSTGLFFTYPNADPGGRRLIAMVDEFVSGRPNAYAFNSLGQLRYLSLMSVVDAVVGNSSSGLYETPSFRIPTVNIGDRQRGRLMAASVLNCPAEHRAILTAIQQALDLDCSDTVNPYGDGYTTSRITAILRDLKDAPSLLQKSFCEWRP